MLLRLRWFMLGAFTSTVALLYVAVQVRRVGRRLSPATLARDGGRRIASRLDGAADRIDPAPRQHGSVGRDPGLGAGSPDRMAARRQPKGRRSGG